MLAILLSASPLTALLLSPSCPQSVPLPFVQQRFGDQTVGGKGRWHLLGVCPPKMICSSGLSRLLWQQVWKESASTGAWCDFLWPGCDFCPPVKGGSPSGACASRSSSLGNQILSPFVKIRLPEPGAQLGFIQVEWTHSSRAPASCLWYFQQCPGTCLPTE